MLASCSPSKDGWLWPDEEQRAHYYVGPRSLCDRERGTLEGYPATGPEADAAEDNCYLCRRKVQSLGGSPMELVRATNDRIIGSIDRGIFRKRISGKRHILRHPPALGIDRHAFLHHVAPSCHTIEVECADTGERYTTSVAVFKQHSEQYRSPTKGYGEQLILRLELWSRDEGAVQLPMKGGA